MTANLNENQQEWQPRQWIVPPGLSHYISRFEVRTKMIIHDFATGRSRPLLIHGPSGVGKSLFTEYFIHTFQELTSNKNLVYINCAAIPGTLLESELFGYEKGSHTGANKRKIGFFEAVGDGVIVLEEIGEMAKNIQAKLLMVIESKLFSRLGSTVNIKFKAQIVATSNAPKNKFREDFWYRLDVFIVPPIYKRRSDILYYINNFNKELFKVLSKDTVLALISYNWPGNVREIERVCNIIRENIEVQRGITLSQDEIFDHPNDGGASGSAKDFYEVEKELSGFTFDKTTELALKIVRNKIDIKKIDTILSPNFLSFFMHDVGLFDDDKLILNFSEDINGEQHFKYEYDARFDLVYHGFLVFCKLFFQNPYSHNDILDLKEFTLHSLPGHYDLNTLIAALGYEIKEITDGKTILPHENDPHRILGLIYVCNFIHESDFYDIDCWPTCYIEAFNESLKYLTKINDIPIYEMTNLQKFFEKNRTNQFVKLILDDEQESRKESIQEIPIEDITLDDLKELYYETLCNKIGLKHGSQKRIAEIVQLSTGRISQEFTELKIKEKFSNPNFPPRKRLVFLK